MTQKASENMPNKVLIALPPAMLEQIDFIAGVEHRTRSDLIREALRRYMDHFKRTAYPMLQVVQPQTNFAPVEHNTSTGETNG